MNETVIIKKEDLVKAHANGCKDVQSVLEDLFPDDIPEKPIYCCPQFQKLMQRTMGHDRVIWDSLLGDYYVYPDQNGWTVRYCLSCGARYDGKKWTARV